VANGRGPTPDAPVYARDPVDFPEVSGLLELIIPHGRNIRVGVSGWTNKVESKYLVDLGDVEADDSEDMELLEIGFSPYATIMLNPFSLLVEWAYQVHQDEKGNLPESEYVVQAFTVEVSVNLLNNKLHPYVRYDVTDLPSEGGGPYIGLRGGDAGLERVYIPNFEAVMVGAAYDVTAFNRLKLEYIHHLQGPRKTSGITLQTAFAF
jgi:hypothetical protein